MALLPPWVIVHGTKDFGVDDKGNRRPIYLGAAGWTAQRSEALSFDTQGEAADWLRTAERMLRAMLKNAAPRIVQSAYDPKPEDVQPGSREHIRAIDAIRSAPKDADYDPYSSGV